MGILNIFFNSVISAVFLYAMCSSTIEATINYSFPSVVVDTNDNRIAIFHAQDGVGNFLVQGSVWTTGSGWSTPVTLSTTSRSAFSPTITVNKTTGNVIATWSAFDLSAGVDFVEAVMYPVNGGWGTTYTLSETSEDAAFGDQKATIDDSNQVVVMWTSLNPNNGITSIRATKGTFGSSPNWNTPVTVAAGES
jgi:hypothetical protein